MHLLISDYTVFAYITSLDLAFVKEVAYVIQNLTGADKVLSRFFSLSVQIQNIYDILLVFLQNAYHILSVIRCPSC